MKVNLMFFGVSFADLGFARAAAALGPSAVVFEKKQSSGVELNTTGMIVK